MSAEPDRNTQFISKLIELSQRGTIEWKPHENGGYTANIFGQLVRAVNVKQSPPSWAPPMAGSYLPDKPVLEIIDDHGKVGYTFENISGLNNLIYIAAYHGSKVGELMNKVLAS